MKEESLEHPEATVKQHPPAPIWNGARESKSKPRGQQLVASFEDAFSELHNVPHQREALGDGLTNVTFGLFWKTTLKSGVLAL